MSEQNGPTSEELGIENSEQPIKIPDEVGELLVNDRLDEKFKKLPKERQEDASKAVEATIQLEATLQKIGEIDRELGNIDALAPIPDRVATRLHEFDDFGPSLRNRIIEFAAGDDHKGKEASLQADTVYDVLSSTQRTLQIEYQAGLEERRIDEHSNEQIEKSLEERDSVVRSFGPQYNQLLAAFTPIHKSNEAAEEKASK